MNCSYCAIQRAERGLTPKCETPSGCDIGDIAPDIELNRIVSEFLNFKMLGAHQGYSKVQEHILKSVGLDDEPSLLCELEFIIKKYQDYKNKTKSNHKQAGLKTYGNRRG